MKIDLAVIGQGAVSPAGMALGPLLQGEPVATPLALVSQPDRTWPVLRVNLKDPAFARWQKEPRLRRASPITLFMVEAAEQALAGISAEDRRETGLIAAFSAGCLAYTHRFFEGIVKQGQKTASPALFPETVFNSPMSHVASVLGLNGAAYALVGDEAAWVAALKTAAVWLRLGRVKQVLVLGAEEFDPLVLDAYHSARWLRSGFVPSEGAAALLVRSRTNETVPVILSARDGLVYRSKKEMTSAASRLFENTDASIPCYSSAQRNSLASLEKKALQDRPRTAGDQPYLGEAFTASTGWHTLRALAQLDANQARILQPVWGLNHQFGLLELGKET